MKETVPPGIEPAVDNAVGGGKRKAFGKPLEMMGLQSYGTKVRVTIRAMFAGLRFSKPRETVGRKAKLGA